MKQWIKTNNKRSRRGGPKNLNALLLVQDHKGWGSEGLLSRMAVHAVDEMGPSEATIVSGTTVAASIMRDEAEQVCHLGLPTPPLYRLSGRELWAWA